MALLPGARLGPYEVVELLGAGGMGEVYRARDPRLGRDVAVKVLPEEVAGDTQRLGFFEREARAVAALNHPNILTVFDVGTHEGVPYVVTELLEGENLRELVSRRSPTVKQVLGYGLQAARGLEAAHGKDIVHRDLKPENLFLTTDGRVKVLDFGLAKLVRREQVQTDAATPSRSTAVGQVVGTVAYMSPEQARGHPVDARSDVFSFGVVLYELLADKHPFKRGTAAATLTAIVEETPADLENLSRGIPPAVGGIVRRCLEKAREERYGSGHDVAMVLEAVLAAPSEAVSLLEVEERSPYPGLSSFTEKDAGVFFGREEEVEALWGRIRNRKLLALIGPSGAGKTSFVRAGVVASRPDGWKAMVVTPGAQPLRGLGRALGPELAGDTEALGRLADVEDPEVAVQLVGRWRRDTAEALLVVDQFEELFTLNPSEAQKHFATLLARLASEADIHVLLSLRDDFLIRCCEREPLAPVLEGLTALLALTPEDLRRAIEEPAKKRGYRFEDEALVGEVVQAVEGARAALPLLAFAVARLWEKRDRETKILTRTAYEEIGGVAGAVAQHAEATMDRIGSERQGLVRELFRNLVTAQGTRAVMERDALLSAFPDQEAAAEVLGRLIDARLLTSYEVEGKEDEPSHHRVEVVHESLLKAWPRLVRWQTQDEDSAQLRDQLKQAAHLWEEKGRTPDLLWSGTAFREYQLWRERYPGRLTALEEDFSDSMVARARRRRRIRRGVVAAAFLVLAGVAAAVAVSRQEAVASARRAEASKLLALAQARLEDDPTEALALTTASLELSDTEAARVFAVRILSEAPPAIEIRGRFPDTRSPSFSPEGSRLAVGGHSPFIPLWSEEGGDPVALAGHETLVRASNAAWWTTNGLLVTGNPGFGRFVHIWSGDETKVRTIEFGAPSYWEVGLDGLLVETPEREDEDTKFYRLRSWRLPDGEEQELGRVGAPKPTTRTFFDPRGNGWFYVSGNTVYRRPLPAAAGGRDQLFSRHAAPVRVVKHRNRPDLLLFIEESGETHLWSFSTDEPPRAEVFQRPSASPGFVYLEPNRRWFSGNPHRDRSALLWDRHMLPGSRPLNLRRSGSWYGSVFTFHPSGGWYVAATAELQNLTMWPLSRPLPSVVDGYDGWRRPLAFSPDGRWLGTSWADGKLRLWPLDPTKTSGVRVLGLPEAAIWGEIAFDPAGRYLFVAGSSDRAYVAPLDGSTPRRLRVFSEDTMLEGAVVSPSGRFVATAFSYGTGERTLRVWDLERDELRLSELPEGSKSPGVGGEPDGAVAGYAAGVFDLHFADDHTLYTGGDGGLRRWNLVSGKHELIAPTEPMGMMTMAMTAEGGRALTLDRSIEDWSACRRAVLIDIAMATTRALEAFGECVREVALDPTGTVAATVDVQGVVRVGTLDGEPHLLLGHEGPAERVAISPDLRWVASSGEDNTLRLWPMPDLDKPPLHTLPHRELVAKLRALTNLRAVRDPEAPNGWKIDLDPFPGWKEVPTW